MGYNPQEKLINNIEAVKIALDWKEGKVVFPDEIEVLQTYSGFGGIKAILFPFAPKSEWEKLNASEADLRLYPLLMEFHELLKTHYPENDYQKIVGSIKNSVLTSFYTPSFVPQTLYTNLKNEDASIHRLYEPSSGAGVFIHTAATIYQELDQVTAVEKDLLTARVLAASCSGLEKEINVHAKGFEEMPATDNGSFDAIVSNIPFGNFTVFDKDLRDPALSGKIHNYFFAKGLEKIRNGGLLSFITTDAFLNNPSNRTAREYIFNKADFISLTVLPDNLMKEEGGTEAPSHLLIVQKNETKKSVAEESLLQTVKQKNEYGDYFVNQYILDHPEIITGNEIGAGKNQYGQAHQRVWQTGAISSIRKDLHKRISKDLQERFKHDAFAQSKKRIAPSIPLKKLHFLPQREQKNEEPSLQLDLFGVAASQDAPATVYLTDIDQTVIQKNTARIFSSIRTSDEADKDAFVAIAAKSQIHKGYVYKLYSNLEEFETGIHWMSAGALEGAFDKLALQLKSFDHDFYHHAEGMPPALFVPRGTAATIELQPFYKEGILVVHNDQVGYVSFLEGEKDSGLFLPITVSQNELSFYKKYTAVRDRYLTLDGSNDKRNLLNDAYEEFVKEYGQLNAPQNRRSILKDEAFGSVLLASLERKEGERYVPADVLTQSLDASPEVINTEDPIEALSQSLNVKGRVDISFIAAVTGQDEDYSVKALAEHICINPASGAFETVDQYLSGNVVEKREAARVKCLEHPDNIFFQKSLAAIEKVQPQKIPFELLDFNLGERWIPLEYYNQFASQLFQLPTTVNYFSSVDSFKVQVQGSNAKLNVEYAVSPKAGHTTYGHSLLEHALENTSPFYTYEIKNGDRTIRVPDNEAIQLAHQKIESIRSGFIDWLNSLPANEKRALEELYNRTFNCYVLREYNGSHLSFPGLNKKSLGIEDLYPSQKDAAWRIIQNRGALIDHEVGIGKTLTMVVASREMKRLGLIQKPMILALKANLAQITETYKKAYPHAKVLAPGENDFSPSRRERIFHEIKNNNWDCIILTHDQFGKIPQSPEIQKEILQEEIENIERDLQTLKDLGGTISRSMLKGLEIRKNNLNTRLQGILSAIEEKKDQGISFKELGVDHLFVDEAHKFKNLTFTTRHNRVAGLGNTEGSAKALNMLFAVRTLQEKFNADLCVTFLSGTPVSNSLTEMYLLFKYLRPKELERQGIQNFDAWAAVFARKSVDFEFSVTNEIIAKERFRHFIKVPELALFYNEITDYKTAKHIQLDRPELDEQLVNIPPTPDQKEFIQKLMEFARTGDGCVIGRRNLTNEEDKGRMLIATNYAKKMAADMRLIDPAYEDHPDNKVSRCAAKIAAIYRDTEIYKGTQIVFSDIGTPKAHQFNIYDALKNKLVNEYLIPPATISFIHDWSVTKKPELFHKMNSGEIRILLGSTDKAGTGLNVQQRVVAMHHLDIPWKPAELEQRNGRGARQGNIIARDYHNNKVHNYIYAVEGSLDNYKFNLLKNKQTFIAQLKNSTLHVRSIDEGALDEKGGMNFSEYIAILSGDTTLLQKSKLERKLAVLESLRFAHGKEIHRSKIKLEHLIGEKNSTENTIQKLSIDEAQFIKELQFDKDGAKLSPLHLNVCDHHDSETLGTFLIDLSRNWKPRNDSDEMIGSLYGFSLYIRQQKELAEENREFFTREFNTFYVQGGELKYTYNSGHLNLENPKLAARYFLHALERISPLKEKYQKTLSEINRSIPQLEAFIAKPFEKEKEMQSLKLELSSLEREISLNIQKKTLLQNNSPPTSKAITVDLHPEGSNVRQLLPEKPKKSRGMRL